MPSASPRSREPRSIRRGDPAVRSAAPRRRTAGAGRRTTSKRVPGTTSSSPAPATTTSRAATGTTCWSGAPATTSCRDRPGTITSRRARAWARTTSAAERGAITSTRATAPVETISSAVPTGTSAAPTPRTRSPPADPLRRARSSDRARACALLPIAFVPLEGELHETIDQLRIRNARDLPELRIHRDGGELGDRVDLVQEQLSAAAAFRLAAAEEEVHARHAGAVDRAERLDRHPLH